MPSTLYLNLAFSMSLPLTKRSRRRNNKRRAAVSKITGSVISGTPLQLKKSNPNLRKNSIKTCLIYEPFFLSTEKFSIKCILPNFVTKNLKTIIDFSSYHAFQ